MDVSYLEAAMAVLGLASIVIGSFAARLIGVLRFALALPTKRQTHQSMRQSQQPQRNDT
jgi:hypothetical protein